MKMKSQMWLERHESILAWVQRKRKKKQRGPATIWRRILSNNLLFQKIDHSPYQARKDPEDQYLLAALKKPQIARSERIWKRRWWRQWGIGGWREERKTEEAMAKRGGTSYKDQKTGAGRCKKSSEVVTWLQTVNSRWQGKRAGF